MAYSRLHGATNGPDARYASSPRGDAVTWELFLPLAAAALDAGFADPEPFPHPVRWLGALLNRLEPLARSMASRPAGLRLAGVGCLFFTAGLAGGLAWWLANLAWLGPLLALYAAYAGLALGGLLRAGRDVECALAAGDIPNARLLLARLVSRDVLALDEAALRKTLAETLSENLNDGFVAPFLWLCLLGPAGLWGYKAVSTMDSMWGYRTDRWRDLGWAAARADDALAWLPARLTAAALLLAGLVSGRLRGRGVGEVWRAIRVDAARTDSPNAGWPMAAAAWILNRPVGGDAIYFGKLKRKPRLGPDQGCWAQDDISALLRLLGLAAGLSATALWPLWW